MNQNHRVVSQAMSWPCLSLAECAGKVPHRTQSSRLSDGSIRIKCSIQCRHVSFFRKNKAPSEQAAQGLHQYSTEQVFRRLGASMFRCWAAKVNGLCPPSGVPSSLWVGTVRCLRPRASSSSATMDMEPGDCGKKGQGAAKLL